MRLSVPSLVGTISERASVFKPAHAQRSEFLQRETEKNNRLFELVGGGEDAVEIVNTVLLHSCDAVEREAALYFVWFDLVELWTEFLFWRVRKIVCGGSYCNGVMRIWCANSPSNIFLG